MRKGFTLIELLITIAILAVLAAAVVVVLNPTELARKGRDSIRLSDFSMLDSAIALTLVESIDAGTGTTGVVYVSLPDSDNTCANHDLPPLPDGMQYSCATEANFRKVNGTGWIPINFAGVLSGSPLTTLPVDPVNATSGNLYYTYSKGSWLFTAGFESEKYQEEMIKDKGPNVGRYEIGSNLELLASTPFGRGVIAKTPPGQSTTQGGSLSVDLRRYLSGPISAGNVTIEYNAGELGGYGDFTFNSSTKAFSAALSPTVPPGKYTIVFTVTNLDTGISANTGMTVTVSGASIPDQIVIVGIEKTIDINGYIGETSEVTVDDGSPLPEEMAHDGSTLRVYAREPNIGSYNLMAIRHSNGEKIYFTLTVVDANIPNQVAYPGQFFSFDPALYFADPPEFNFSLDGEPLPGWLGEREHRYLEGNPDIEEAVYSIRVFQSATDVEKFFTLTVQPAP